MTSIENSQHLTLFLRCFSFIAVTRASSLCLASKFCLTFNCSSLRCILLVTLLSDWLASFSDLSPELAAAWLAGSNVSFMGLTKGLAVPSAFSEDWGFCCNWRKLMLLKQQFLLLLFTAPTTIEFESQMSRSRSKHGNNLGRPSYKDIQNMTVLPSIVTFTV